MIIYGALLIPLIVMVYCLIFYRHKIVLWEIAVPFVIAIILIFVAKLASEWSQTKDTEYWGHLGTMIVHKEPYSYLTTCTETYPCGTDSKGNTEYCTRTYPCVEDVSRSCYLAYPSRSDDGSGEGWEEKSTYISYAKYKQLDERWKNNGHKFKQAHKDYYNRPNHGGVHWVYWDKKWETAEPMVMIHTWENKVQASSSVLNYPDVSEEEIKDWQLYKYPEVDGAYELPTILDHYKSKWAADLHLRYINADLGPRKKVRMWVLMFRDKDIQAARMQEAYWKGGNKNEIVICIGTDQEYNISWAHVFSWTDEKVLLTNIRNKVLDYKQATDETILDFSRYLIVEVGQKFVKKDFREFDYLKIQPTTTAIIITYILVLLSSIGTTWWVIKNEFDESSRSSYKRRRYR
jgi:hypothetical protein